MKPRSREAMMDHLMDKSMPVSESGCWIWLGVTNTYGYGRVLWNNRHLMAHRVSYELFKGPISADLQTDHLCKVRCCINPDHLEAVTPRVNTMRSRAVSAVNAAKTHCINGHTFDTENTRTYHRGSVTGRVCRACKREEWHRRQQRKATA